MNTHKKLLVLPMRTKSRFQLSMLTSAMLASISTFTFNVAFAADSFQTLEEANAEVLRLRAQLQATQQLAGQSAQQSSQQDANQIAVLTADPEKEQAVDQSIDQPTDKATNQNAAEDAIQLAATYPTAAGFERRNEVDEVLVKAQAVTTKSLEALKDTPISISVVSGVELEKQNIINFRDIITRVGNVGMGYNNPQAASLTIRGVGWASGVGQLDPSVGTEVDGEGYGTGAIAASTNFIDLESFDVSRGPQGTQGGKNSSIGRITIKTRSPSFTPDAEASLTFGDLNTIRTQVAVGGPVISDLLAWRGTFYREQADGQVKNINEPKTTLQNRDRTFGRLQFLLTPTQTFSAKLSVEFTPTINEYGSYVAFPRPTPSYYDTLDNEGLPNKVNQDLEQAGRLSRSWFAQEKNYSIQNDLFGDEYNMLNQAPSKYSTKGASLNLDWDIGEHKISSISAWRDYYFDNGISSAGPNSLFDIDRSPTPGHVEYTQFSQELKLSSDKGEFIDYQTGIYYFHNDMPDRRSQISYGSDAGAYYANSQQYTRLDADANGRLLLISSLDRLRVNTKDDIDNTSFAGYGNINFHFSDALVLNAGLRLTQEDRSTNSQRLIENQGFAEELNPAFVNNVNLRGFNSSAMGSLTTNSDEQLAVANLVAKKYFNAASYSALSGTQKQQVADAKLIRSGRIGSLYQNTEAESFEELLPTATLSPSYAFSDNNSAYFTYQHGEKAGISQVIGATLKGGKSASAKEEVSDSYELGFKSYLFNRDLYVAADVFVTDIKDYLQPMYFEDKVQTQLNNDNKIAYTSGLGNVPKVRTKGVELDLIYNGIEYTTLRFAGAYNDARYVDFPFLAKPLEQGGGTSLPYYDASGKTLPGAPKFTFNLNADYARPVFSSLEFHTNLNYRYTTSYNNDPSLSRYAVADAYGITNLSIGIGGRDKLFDASLLVTNLFATRYDFYTNWNTFAPSYPRWVGVMISTKL